MRKLKLLLNKFAIIVPKKKKSLGIILISNEPIKYEIVNACNHPVTYDIVVLIASLDCCNQQLSKLVQQKLWRFSKFTNDSYLVYLFSVEFCLSHFFLFLFFSRTCFHVVFCFVFSQLLAIEKCLAISNDQQRIKLKTPQCN